MKLLPWLLSLALLAAPASAATFHAGGVNGQLQFNNNLGFGGLTLGGDCTLAYSTGALTCTKTNGTAFAPSATINATNASNVTSGTLGNTRLTALSANQVLGALTATTPSGLTLPSCSGASNALTWASGTGFGCNTISGGSGSTGTVTSVTFTGDGTVLSNTASSAVTSSGTLTAALNTQAAHTALAGPATGTAAPTFRQLATTDLSDINTYSPNTSGPATYSYANTPSNSFFHWTGANDTTGTGTTNKPAFYLDNGAIQPTEFSTAGTYIGINPPNGFTGNFFDLKVNNGSVSTTTAKLSAGGFWTLNGSGSGILAGGAITSNTSLTTSGGVSGQTMNAAAAGGFNWTTRSQMKSPSDGGITFYNTTGTGFTRLQFGGTTSSFPSIAVSGTGLAVQLADGSGSAPIAAKNIVGILSSVSDTGTTAANTALYTVPTGETCVITGYVVKVTAASAITNGGAAGIGNVAGTNNIAASQTMNTLTTTTSTFEWPIVGASVQTPAGGVIYYNRGTAATGTSETETVDLIGYNYP